MHCDSTLDCLVIGGGAAGLTAAVYLARYRRRIRLVDAGRSRMQWIPRARNVMGFPDGVAGPALWERMRQHAARYGIEAEPLNIDMLDITDGGVFEAGTGLARMRARTVLLCTGARDIAPDIAGLDDALAHGQVRYCPVCDGFETQNQRVAVLGAGPHGLRESIFVAGFDNRVTWLAMGSQAQVWRNDLDRLAGHGVELVDAPVQGIRCRPGTDVRVQLQDGRELAFDTLYPALGQSHASGLATALGAAAAEDGQLEVDAHLQTTVAGLYAAGDVAQGLNQISVAAGQAAIAATAIHNRL